MTKILCISKTFQRVCNIKNEVERVLLTSCCFSVFLIISRVVYTGGYRYLGLCWNLFLAYIPFIISRLMMKHFEKVSNKWLFGLLFCVWILFIPNSFYIITDLFHLRGITLAPLWFDLLLIMSFAWNGLLLGIFSVRHFEKMIDKIWTIKNVWLYIFPIMMLNALGVYIGRYWRYNSWNIVTNPFALMHDIFVVLFHPMQHVGVWAMTVSWGIFMSLLYAGLKKISKAIA